MFKCTNCGHLFEEGEQAYFSESRGECFGFPTEEELQGCPLCKSDFVEVEPCKNCGSYNLSADDEFCNSCLKDVQRRYSDLIAQNFDETEVEIIRKLLEDGDL